MVHMSSTNSRSNVGAIRSMQIDRGARIRTFRQLHARDTAEFRAEDPPHVDDTNGERYTQALDRLTSFKLRHKKRVRQDRWKADWQQEDAQLQRASKELTKSIEELLKASTQRDGGCHPIAPAWGGPNFSPAGESVTIRNQGTSTTGGSGSHGVSTARINVDLETEGSTGVPQSSPQRQPRVPKELADLSASSQELERDRLSDLQADRSHIDELRAIVAEFMTKSSGGSQEGFVAELLVQARVAHTKAGTYLSERSRELEAEVDSSRRALALALSQDRADRRSSELASVLAKIGFSECEKRADSSGDSGVDDFHGAMMRSEISSRLQALEAEQDSTLAALRSDFLRDAAGSTSAGSVEAALDQNGGWPSDRHFRFMKVIKAAKGATGGVVGGAGGYLGGSSDSSAATTKRLAAGLPGVSPAEISNHESWYRLRGVFLAKKRAEKQRHALKLEELVSWGKKALETLRNEERESAARAIEQEERERRRTELDNLLREQGKARERRDKESREREEKALLDRVVRETEEAERKALEYERKRSAVALYHASLQELRARETDACEAAARAEEADRAQRVPVNRKRVGFRQEKARQKQEEHERREQEAKELEEKRLQVLQRLAASVPYAEACANAEAKLDHITAATAAHFDQFLPHDRSRGHCPMLGYNTGEVFKDARFRLGLYLREAGVSGSTSAHVAVMRAAGPRAPAPYEQHAE